MTCPAADVVVRMLDALPDAVLAYDTRLRVTEWNASTARSTGIPRAAALGCSLFELFPYIAGTRIEEEYRRSLAGETVDARDRCWAPTEGEPPRWYDVTYRPLHDTDGAIVGGMVVTCDVTARRGAEESIAAERRLARAILDTMPAGLVAFDRSLVVTEWNAAAERATGLRRNDALGRAIGDVLPDHREGPLRSNYERVLAGETVHVRDRWYDTARAPNRCYDATFTPLPDGRGAVTGGVMISVDVTDRARVQRVLSDERAALRSIIDAAFAAIVVVDPEMRCTEWNRVAAHWSGVPREAAIGRGIDDLLPALRESAAHAGVVRALQGGSTTGDETASFFAAAASPEVVQVFTAPRLDASGSIAGAVMVALDMSERARARRALEESEARYRELFAQGAAIQLLLDLETLTVVDANERAVEFYGYPRSALIGMAASRLQPDEAASRALVERLRREGSERSPRAHVTAAGETRQLDAAARIVQRNGRQLVLMSMQDVTDRVRAEAERDRLARIVEATPDLVAIGDPASGRVGYLNAAGRALLGVDPDTPLFMADVLPPAEMQRVADEIIPAALRDGVWQGDISLRAADGAGIELSAVVLGHDADDEGSPYLSTIGRDVTDDRRRELALGEARAAAEHASRAKTAFLTSMSHELRTPLSAVIGFAQLLDEQRAGALNATQREYLRDILDGASHLRRVVEDTLDLALVEAGVIDLRPAATDLAEVIGEAVAAVSRLAAQHEVRIVPPAPVAVRDMVTDAGRVRQVLLNFLTNAIKFNRRGGEVRIQVEAVPEDRVRVVVHDTGRGIAPESLGLLFRDFERLGVTDVGGTGLGLAITRRIAETMGGHVGVRSSVGEGSSFEVVLPRVLRVARAPQPVSP